MCQGWFFDQVDRDFSARRNTAIGRQQFMHHDVELGLEALPGFRLRDQSGNIAGRRHPYFGHSIPSCAYVDVTTSDC